MSGKAHPPESVGMERASRRWVVVTTLVCGLFATAGWMIAIYASVHTPNMRELRLPSRDVSESVRDAASFLFAPPMFQSFCFLFSLYPNLRWKKIIARAADAVAPLNMWDTGRSNNFPVLVRVWCAVLCAMSAFSLWLVIQHAGVLLRHL